MHLLDETNGSSVFKTAHAMPWTCYDLDFVNADSDSASLTRKNIMFTSQSYGSGAGNVVTQIKRFNDNLVEEKVNFLNSNGNLLSVEQRLSKFREWNWPIKKDAQGNDLLPTFGEFAFSRNSGKAPSYEDVSSLDVKIKIGCGLGTTIYNYSFDIGTITIRNITIQPQFFCSSDKNLTNITYNSETDGYNELGSELNGELCCSMPEGSNGFAYLYVAVEAGERIELSFPYNATVTFDKKFEQLTFNGDNGQGDMSDGSNNVMDLSSAWRTNVSGKEDMLNLKRDFFRIKMTAKSDFQNIVYNKVNELVAYVKVTPKYYNTPDDNFSKTIKIRVCLTKDTTKPQINFDVVTGAAEININNSANKRQRIVVTPEEAISYAIRTNDSAAPAFIQGKTVANALLAYNQSMLTETEKALDAYKKSFNTITMREKLALYIATDLSGDANANLNSWTTGSDMSTCDLSDLLFSNEVTELQSAIQTELTNKNILVTLQSIKSNATTAAKLQALVTNKLTVTPTALSTAYAKETSNFINNVAMPWMDGQMDEPRKLGTLRDVSCTDANNSDAHKKTLLGQESTILTLLYALKNHHTNSTDDLINRYSDAMNLYSGNVLTRLIHAMRTEYHNVKNWTYKPSLLTDISGAAHNRPSGHYDALEAYRYRLNPVDGGSAFRYLCDIVKICHTGSEPDRVFYGVSQLNNHFSLPGAKPTKADVDTLLYGHLNNDLSDQIIGSGKLINTSSNIGSAVVLDNEFLNRTGNDKHNTDDTTTRACVFYESSSTADVFNSDYSGITKHTFRRSLTESITDVSNLDLNKCFIYNADKTGKAYSEDNFHPENLDFSGIMKVPISSSGKYCDVFVKNDNGEFVEVRETIVDVVTNCENDGGPEAGNSNSAMDLSTSEIRTYASADAIPQSVKDSRKTLIKELLQKMNIVNVGIFQVYRTGNVLQWVANVNDLDAEILPAMDLPEIKLRYRHDVTEECANLYYPKLALKDVESTLVMKLNPSREELVGVENNGTHVNTTKDKFLVSRWSDVYIPLDVSGFLERGEEFKMFINSDKFATTDDNFANVTAAGASTDFTTEIALPDSCADQAIKVQYRNARDPASEWTDVTGKIFNYSCHDNASNLAGNQRNTFGDITTTNSFDPTKSSNVEGTPQFRLCVPSQSKLLNLYRTSNNAGASDEHLENFGTLKRTVTIDLDYTKSAKLKKNVDNTWEIDTDGNDKSLSVIIYVKSDTYEPNIKEQGYIYNKKYTGNTKTLDGALSVDAAAFEPNANISSTSFKAVGHKVIFANQDDQECIPDYTGLQAYDISQAYYSSKSDNTITFVDASINENNFGSGNPVSVISVDNYQVNGVNSASAKIIPLFQRRKDELDWEQDNNVYCKIDNLRKTTDASQNAPRLIPANTNYSVSMSDNGNKILLFRNNNLNYEEWIGGSVGNVVSGHNFFDDSNEPYPELVAVKIEYHEPNSKYGELGLMKEKTLVFIVKPQDEKELQWGGDNNTFHYTVTDGDSELDITNVLSATVEGSSNNIKYYPKGFIDESGTLYYDSSIANTLTDEKYKHAFDASNMVQIGSQQSGLRLIKGAGDIMDGANRTKDLTLSKVSDMNGIQKLKLYVKNPTAVNGKTDLFDTWHQCSYKLILEARLMENDQSNVENCLALVCIDVQQGATDFKLKDNNTYYYSVTETLGTIAEGKTPALNNPEIKLSTFIDKIKHENIGDLYNVTGNKKVTFEIVTLDSDLELCPGSDNDFSNQFLRLKNIEANKTMETPSNANPTKLADYPHYNYERKTEYPVHIRVSANKYREINVEKLPEAYVCELDRAAGPSTLDNTTTPLRTADYKVTSEDLSGSTYNDNLFYFCDPETKKYHGPLSLQPRHLSDLTTTKEVYGKKLLWAYARVSTNASGHTPLYRARGFAISDKPPKPEDTALFLFSVRVQDSYDKPKVCPQPYDINTGVDYYTTDPKNQIQLDNALINVKVSNRHIAYVYTDNIDLGPEDTKDFEVDEIIQSWHPDAGKKISALDVKIHPDMSNQLNASYNNGMMDGDPSGYMNGSNRYGNFNMDSSLNRVVVDYFVESHGTIDTSGRNEISKEEHQGIPQVFGERVDYSGTMYMYTTQADGAGAGTKTKIEASDRRIYRLSKVIRNRLHANEQQSTDNYFRYTTGELRYNNAHTPQVGDVYTFSIAAVTNMLATKNDISYNKSMVDYTQEFYPRINKTPTGGDAGSNIYPQPFLKYVYDNSGERIVTLGYAKATTDGSIGTNATGDHSANQDSLDHGVLLCCRTHFKVTVEADGVSVQMTNPETGVTSIAKGLNFNSVSILDATVNSGSITPHAMFEALEGDVRLFKNVANGSVVMGVYKSGKWTTV
jgi:hypothetical protein